MRAKLVKESLYDTDMKDFTDRNYPLQSPNYESEDSAGIPEEDLDVDVKDNWEKPAEDDEDVEVVDSVEKIDTSDMDNAEDIEVNDDLSDELQVALDNELAFADINRGKIEFRVRNKGKSSPIISGVPLAKLQSGYDYLFKTDDGIKKYDIRKIVLVEGLTIKVEKKKKFKS